MTIVVSNNYHFQPIALNHHWETQLDIKMKAVLSTITAFLLEVSIQTHQDYWIA